MKYLLDTHILLWTTDDNPLIPEKIRQLIRNASNEVYYSSASIWEVEIKHLAKPAKMQVDGKTLSLACFNMKFEILPIEDRHVFYLETLHREEGAPEHHDPFDRIMLAQAKCEGMKFITHDSLIPYYNEECVIKV